MVTYLQDQDSVGKPAVILDDIYGSNGVIPPEDWTAYY